MGHPQNSEWARLFDQACSIISQANSNFTVLDRWSFGGGTALMLQIDHRESFDVDIFVDDPQVLPYLNPQTQEFTLDVNPDAYSFDGTHALKIVFDSIGEIDFIVASNLTLEPVKKTLIRGQKVDLETPAEIIAKKIFYRGASMQPRDMFDIACVLQNTHDNALIHSLQPFKDACFQALAVARKMDSSLAEAVMSKLLYKPSYSGLPSLAQNQTIKLLEAVCDHGA